MELVLKITDGLTTFVMGEYTREDYNFPFTIEGLGRVSPYVLDQRGPDELGNWEIEGILTIEGAEKVLEIAYNSESRTGEAKVHNVSWPGRIKSSART